MASVVPNVILTALEKMTGAKVLVMGDVMLDRYWFGDVDRISPEAPVPVVSVNQRDERVGGAGNVARNIAELGGSVSLLGVVGDDDAGTSVCRIAEESAVRNLLQVEPAVDTTVKLRIMSRNQQLIRADFESRPDQQVCIKLKEMLQSVIGQYDALVLSDYGKGALAEAPQLIDIAATAGVPVLVDPKTNDYAHYRGAAMVTPNLSEFRLASNSQAESQQDIEHMAAELMKMHNIEALLVTLSERGMMLVDQSGGHLHKPARTREVYDVSGAGDTVIAVMSMAKAVGLDDDIALSVANTVAGVVVSKLGTATASIEEVRDALARDKQAG